MSQDKQPPPFVDDASFEKKLSDLDEGLDDNPPGWVGVGFLVSDAGIMVLLVLTLLGWLGLRRPRAGVWFAGLAAIYLVALGVAVFAMSAKPG